MNSKKLARMRRLSTTIELNDIGRVTSATTVRLHANANRPASVPLDCLIGSMDRDPFIMQASQKYLQVFASSDDQQMAERRLTAGTISSFPENSTIINNNNICNISTSNVNMSPSMNPSASSVNTNSLKLLITTKIQMPDAVKKTIRGLTLVLIVSASSAGATQLAKMSLIDQYFYAPYFLAWFWINWASISYPLYLIVSWLFSCLTSSQRKTSKDLFNEAKTMYGPVSSSANSFVIKTLLFMILWLVKNYTYCLALGYLSPSETSALFVSHPAFIYLISWIYFHDAFVSARIISVLLSIIGVVLMAHATGIGTTNFIGIVAAVISSSIAAIFKIVFKSIFGEPTLNKLSLFFTMLGLSNLIFNWPLTFILYITSAEKIVWLGAPWKYICLSALLALALDFVLRSTVMGTFQIIGSVCIFVSCILLLLPPDFTNQFPISLVKTDV